MLTVTVEVWPGGRVLERRVIGVLTLANVSELAEVSDYIGFLDDEPIGVVGHPRSKGAWELVRRALNEHLLEQLSNRMCSGRVCVRCCLCEDCGRHPGTPHLQACACLNDKDHWFCEQCVSDTST